MNVKNLPDVANGDRIKLDTAGYILILTDIISSNSMGKTKNRRNRASLRIWGGRGGEVFFFHLLLTNHNTMLFNYRHNLHLGEA